MQKKRAFFIGTISRAKVPSTNIRIGNRVSFMDLALKEVEVAQSASRPIPWNSVKVLPASNVKDFESATKVIHNQENVIRALKEQAQVLDPIHPGINSKSFSLIPEITTFPTPEIMFTTFLVLLHLGIILKSITKTGILQQWFSKVLRRQSPYALTS